MYLIDSHTHISGKEFDADRDEVLARARTAGVKKILNIGAADGLDGCQRALDLAAAVDDVWTSIGIHPNEAAIECSIDDLKKFCSHPKVVAIGETGLDYYWDSVPKDKQQRWFEAQIALAIELHKPLIIHSREAGEDCLSTLAAHGASAVGGVFHCYSEDAAFARRLLDINFLVSFPGPLTFKKSEALRDIARAIPLSQIMVETDAPYLTPDPFRGKRNEPAYVTHTAQRLAEVKGISVEEVWRVTSENAERLFGLHSPLSLRGAK